MKVIRNLVIGKWRRFYNKRDTRNTISRSIIPWLIAVIFASLLGGLTGGGVVYAIIRQVPTPPVQPAFEASPLIPVYVDISTAVTDAVAHVSPSVVTVINNLPTQRTLFSPSIERTASGSGVII